MEYGVEYKNHPNVRIPYNHMALVGACTTNNIFPKEFPNVVPDNQHLQTDRAKAAGSHPWMSVGVVHPFHIVCTACKAVGQQYGSSKNSKLVVVQMQEPTTPEFIDAFIAIADDIFKRQERLKKSVVTISLSGPVYDPNDLAHSELKEVIDMILDTDVPIVVSAGNAARVPGRANVDTIPQGWAGPDSPMIIVGSTNADGVVSGFSQGGPQVSIHATGQSSSCLHQTGDLVFTHDGTSFAAPIVAGEIANLLAYENVPFDTPDQGTVKNLYNYIRSGAANWARTPGIPMIWNGVTKNTIPASTIPSCQRQQRLPYQPRLQAHLPLPHRLQFQPRAAMCWPRF